MFRALFHESARSFIAGGIRLAVVDAPMHPKTPEALNVKVASEYEEFLAAEAEALGYRWLTKTDLPAFGEEDFVDFSHLNAKGRAKMALAIQSIIEGRPTVTAVPSRDATPAAADVGASAGIPPASGSDDGLEESEEEEEGEP